MIDVLKRLLGGGQRENARDAAIKTDKGPVINVYLKCAKCGEPIHLRIRKSDELQREYDDPGYTFFVQKNVMGNKCYNRMPLRLELNEAYRVVNSSMTGGSIITRAEYDELTRKG